VGYFGAPVRFGWMLGCFAVVLQVLAPPAPARVFETRAGVDRSWEAMIADLAQSDVVLVGEQHDDPNTHKLELAILQDLAAKSGRPITLSLEMFERDVQGTLGHFGMGHLPEADFLKTSRPWPRYATDYKPLVDFAIQKKWPVIAANVPRPIASAVSKTGLAALHEYADGARRYDAAHFAASMNCPTGADEYFKRFLEAMGTHPDASSEKFYLAQCVKDETMGESIADAYNTASSGGRPLVVHYNGAFHSDFRLGTAARVERRLPGKRISVVTVVPVDAIAAPAPDAAERRRAEYLIYTEKKKPAHQPGNGG
jgi:uncharacterized iron-regulated protein